MARNSPISFYPFSIKVRKKEMLRLMAKRKRSEVKVGNSLESKSKKKKKETGLREEMRLMDEQERLEQLEKRLESKVHFFCFQFHCLDFLPSFAKLEFNFP